MHVGDKILQRLDLAVGLAGLQLQPAFLHLHAGGDDPRHRADADQDDDELEEPHISLPQRTSLRRRSISPARRRSSSVTSFSSTCTRSRSCATSFWVSARMASRRSEPPPASFSLSASLRSSCFNPIW